VVLRGVKTCTSRIIQGIIVTAMWVEMSIKISYKNDRFGIVTILTFIDNTRDLCRTGIVVSVSTSPAEIIGGTVREAARLQQP
jgi:hypothetical protein